MYGIPSGRLLPLRFVIFPLPPVRLSEVVIGVGLSLDVCALGFGVLSRVLVRFDGWAFVLDGADPFGELDGQGVLLSFPNVTFRTGVRFAMLSVFAHWISSK